MSSGEPANGEIPLTEKRVQIQPTSIDALRITNYRSCIDTTIDLQPDLSVLIGPNGTGKTTILNAFMLLKLLSTERPSFRPVEDALNPSLLRAIFTTRENKVALRTTLQPYSIRCSRRSFP
jgi:DNA repair ATPase RecN